MSDKIKALSAAIAAFARDRDWEQFHTPKNLAMALSVEASEIAVDGVATQDRELAIRQLLRFVQDLRRSPDLPDVVHQR
ncbi:MAG: nucleotide pyrophosphohydrolase, partial [Elusimicrobiota bacterium]